MKTMNTKLFRLLPVAAAVLLTAMSVTEAATVKALSFAITGESGKTADKNIIQQYIQGNPIDFGLFDYAKQESFFINADFTDGVSNFKVVRYFVSNTDFWKYVIYDSDKYELVNVPADDKSASNIAAVFRDANGDEFALLSVRGTYKTSTSLAAVKTYIEGITNDWPDAKAIVTYNARLSGTYNGNSYSNILDTYLTETATGPQMTRLGRTIGGGAYMCPNDVPTAYSVEAVDSIDTSFPGLLVTLTYPTKYKVIFNDWDGTGLQTNVVFAGESVTPPVPVREGYTFTGWDHDASEFAAVTAAFTATAQYATDSASLLVFGDPEDIGTADPAYGTAPTVAAGDSFTASVTGTNLLGSGVERWVCTGYTHYEITDVVTGAKTVVQEGDAATFGYTHVFHDELVWRFTNEWLVSVSTSAGGTVSAASETWVRNGEAMPLLATPDAGYDFWRWDGDTDGIADVSAASIAPTVTAARTLRAVFAPTGTDASVQYVAPTGDDGNNGYSAESPKLTVQAAIDTLAAMPGYGTVHVAPGTYVVNETIVITNNITVAGATGNPEDVILRARKVSGTINLTTLLVNHPGALVTCLSLENGHRYTPTSPYGANVSIDSEGGIVSNCVIREAKSEGNYARGAGAWLNSDDALLTHCVITNNSASGSGYQPTATGGSPVYGGMFVHIDKGTVANCLIADNHDSGSMNSVSQEKQAWGCGVTVRDGRILNCTVVTNEARCTGGIYLYPAGYATNVVVAGCVNKCSYPSAEEPTFTDVGFRGTLANASHCASDGGETLDATCVAGTAATFFRDMAAHDWRPKAGGPLVNKGVSYGGIAALDLIGAPRSQGRPDIGCYERPPSCMVILVQ